VGAKAKLAAAALGVGTLATPGAVGVEGIPNRALTAYVSASETAPCDVPWWDLAAIGAVETGHGTHGGAHIQADGTMTVMAVSSAAAMGPMQFIGPTWERYGQGDINNVDDSAKAAARLLCANGYEADRTNAIGAYNGGENWPAYAESRAYVQSVDRFAAAYQTADRRSLPATTKERSASRAWDSLVRGWLKVGTVADRLGPLGTGWRDVDNWLFGADPQASKPSTVARKDGFTVEFGSRLDRLIADAPGGITVRSGYRTPSQQLELYERYQSGAGNLAAWSDGVSCSSDHCRGLAADLAFADDATAAWSHENAGRYGLVFDVEGESWHVSLAR